MKRSLIPLLLLTLLLLFCACSDGQRQSNSEPTAAPTDATDGAQTEQSTQASDGDKTEAEPTDAPIVDEPVIAENFDYMNKPYTVSDGIFVAPRDIDANMSNPIYSVALYNDERIKGDFAAELELNLKITSAKAGIVFNATPTENAKYSGYAFMITHSRVSLSEITIADDGTVQASEIISHAIEYLDAKQTLKLRVERNGEIMRLYFLDDLSDELVPWPEIEINDSLHNGGTLIGYIDDGRGASFGDISIYGAEALFDAGFSGDGEQFTNPVTDKSLADPQVIYWEGKYYMYSTSYWRGFRVYESEDLVNWTNMGVCLEGAWDTEGGKFWAPEVSVKDGKFYMVFSNSNDLGIAVSDSPLGPFIAPEQPLLMDTIDGHLFFDDDGRVYLYYVSWRSTYGIYGCELDPSLNSVIEGSERLLITAALEWEKQGERIAEGPAILKHNGTYYLTYSGSHYSSKDYAVGYATADSPLGEYEKYKGSPILSRSATVNGTGHHSFVRVENTGELFIVYHCHRPTPEYTDRIICIDRVRFSPSKYGIDRLEVYGPTSTPQNYPQSP